MAIKKKTPKNKPPRNKARAKVVRKARTENDIKTMMSKYTANTFSTDPKFNKSMFRAIFKFKKEYRKVCEKYKTFPELDYKLNILNAIEHEIESV